jgi:hypothetical protein
VLNLRNQTHSFRPKHSWIGFDVTGRMIYIGRCRQEHVFIIMAPDDFVSCAVEMDAPISGNSKVAPHVTKYQFRKFILFLAKCLAEMQFSDIYCNDPYADVELPGALEKSTNILSVYIYQLVMYTFNLTDFVQCPPLSRSDCGANQDVGSYHASRV